MKRGKIAMHVAKITSRPKNGKAYHSYLVRHSYRENGKVKHRTLANITHLPPATRELVRRSLKGESFLAPSDSFEIHDARPHGHVAAALGTLKRLGVERMLSSRRDRKRDLVVAMITARVLTPASKFATARALQAGTHTSTLGEELDLSACDENDLYEAMDWLAERQPAIEKKLAAKHLQHGSLVLYDLTSTYFEGRHCPLARLGHSRDGRKDKAQIVFGLLCTEEGCPVAVEVFSGNTSDPATVGTQIEKLRQRFGLERVVLVGDRGMITEARIREDLREAKGVSWVTALRAPAIQNLVSRGDLQLSLFDEQDLGEITSTAYPGERLVVCRNPLLAEERARKRQDLLAATERDLAKVVQATRRKQRPLRGQDRIGVRVGKVLGRFKMGKHFVLEITDTDFRYERDEARIAREAALDGIYVIRTDLSAEALSTEDTVLTYKSLSRVERAFRCLKLSDLQVRPIHHRLEHRVRAHVFLCMLAYYVEWHMRRALAPMLFQDHDTAGASKRRAGVVAKASRSHAAEAKACEKKSEDGRPVQGFRGLLKTLATMTRNTIRPAGEGAVEFDLLSTPTALQQRAFDLLQVRPAM
jgi:transposase